MIDPLRLATSLSFTCIAGLLCVARADGQTVPPDTQDSWQTVYYDFLDAQGRLTGGRTTMLLPHRRAVQPLMPAFATTLTSSLFATVNPENRVDLVFVGDGYTSAQLGAYANQVNTIGTNFFNKDPYLTYKPYFTVHRVDVVSAESGVDNDPTQGVQKNTALDMGYWCGGVERALCVSVSKAYSYANNAPDVDLVAAIANSNMYGGVGYPSNDLATCAGSNGAALEIMRHEFGHALGNLADEYDYGGNETYTGGEPSEPNLSKLTAPQLTAQSKKWFRWVGVNNPTFDGMVSAFEGGGYSELGIYRPTNNSLMRNLDRPFNLPGAEAIVIEIYKIVHPIDASSSTTAVYDANDVLFVTPLAPAGAGHALAIQWSLNGVPIPGATHPTLDLSTLALGDCGNSVSVTVKDNTTLVRDEAARAQWLTQTLTFDVFAGSPLFQNYCTTSPNTVGPGAEMAHIGTSSVAANDLSLLAFGCPPNANGLFFYGQNETSVPFGNGTRCVGNPFFRLPTIQANILGDAQFDLDLGALPPAGAISAGETWKFQLWYRNPAAGGAGFNASDGLSIRFCP